MSETRSQLKVLPKSFSQLSFQSTASQIFNVLCLVMQFSKILSSSEKHTAKIFREVLRVAKNKTREE